MRVRDRLGEHKTRYGSWNASLGHKNNIVDFVLWDQMHSS